MKTTSTRIITLLLWAFSLCFSSRVVAASPRFQFKNAQLIAGTEHAEGAQYLFPNVTAGTDAIISILSLKNITINDIDGGSGFDDAFQPIIYVPGKKKGQADFDISFYYAGTRIPRIMLEVPMTAIDIDGYEFPDEKIYEFDVFQRSLNYLLNFDGMGSSLDIKFSGGALGMVTATNKNALVYDGVDTLQRDVMFGVIYAGVSSIKYSTGADNKSKYGMERLRSVYFQNFNYPGTILAKNDLLQFSGRMNGTTANLQWELAANNMVRSASLERSIDGSNFNTVYASKAAESVSSSFNDYQLSSTGNYYRLKMTSYSGDISYSNIVVLNTENRESGTGLNVYPTISQNGVFTTNLSVNSAQNTSVRLIDLHGKLVYQQKVQLQKGMNSVTINTTNTTDLHGQFVVVIEVDGQLQNSRVMFP